MSIINISNIEQLLSLASSCNNFIIILFYSNICSFCDNIMPVYKAFSKYNEFSHITFATINTNIHTNLRKEFSICFTPTFKILFNGIVKDELVGDSPSKLYSLLYAYCNKN